MYKWQYEPWLSESKTEAELNLRGNMKNYSIFSISINPNENNLYKIIAQKE